MVALRLRHLAASGAARGAMFGVLSLVTTWFILRTATQINLFRDAQVLFSYERDAAWTVQHFGQLPLWNPYYCGGLFALGTPQSRFASPTFLLSLIFGPGRGEALTIFALLMLGLEGTFRYARARGGGALGSALAAPAFALSGVFIASPFLGWTNFFGFELCPWALLGIWRALRGDVLGAVAAAWWMAFIVGFGGTYAAPFTVLLWTYELVVHLVQRRTNGAGRLQAIALFVLAATLAAGASGVRLVPLLETLYVAPRVVAGRPSMSLTEAARALVGAVAVKDGNLALVKQMYVVGAGALSIAVLSAGRRRSWSLILLAGLAIWTALGYSGGAWGLFPLLKRAPLFSALRYPERYLIVVALVASVMAARTVRWLEIAAHRRSVFRVVVAACCAALLANTAFLARNFRQVAASRMLAAAPPQLDRPFQQARGNRWRAAYYMPMSRGSLSCWDAYPVPMSPHLRGDLPADEYLLDPTAGTVSRSGWSPNAIDLDVSLTRNAELRINQNYHPGWRSSAGRVHDADGLLAVALPTGNHRVRLYFRPRAALAGAAATALAGAFSLLLWRRQRRRSAASGPGGDSPRVWPLATAAAIAPMAGFVLVTMAISEPWPAPAPLRAPTGETVVTVSPPSEATTVDARFGDAITLTAESLPRDETLVPGEPFHLELDWRTAGVVPPETKILIALRVGEQTVARADHSLISAAIPLAAATRGATLRDVLTVILPSDLPVGALQVWVAIKDERADELLPIRAPDLATDQGYARIAVLDRQP